MGWVDEGGGEHTRRGAPVPDPPLPHSGAHTFFMKAGTVARDGGYVVNLLHYEDAAALAAAVLSGAGTPPDPALGWRSRAFIGADGVPVTFAAMCDAAVGSGVYGEGAKRVEFSGAPGASAGKRLLPLETRKLLHWAPKYASFASFVAGGGRDAYTDDERLSAAGAPHAG